MTATATTDVEAAADINRIRTAAAAVDSAATSVDRAIAELDSAFSALAAVSGYDDVIGDAQAVDARKLNEVRRRIQQFAEGLRVEADDLDDVGTSCDGCGESFPPVTERVDLASDYAFVCECMHDH